MSDEQLIPITPVPEVPAEFPSVDEKAVADAIAAVRGRSFSGRNPELGKMVNCRVHGWRHRQFEINPKGCEQVFTYSVKDKDGRRYEQFREEVVTDPEGEEGPNGEVPKKVTLVPDLRTAIPANSKPTMRQILGAASVAKKRFHPHYSKIKLQFIERTRVVYDNLKFVWNLLDKPSAKASKLERARIIAARQLRKERRAEGDASRRRQETSRRINRGFTKSRA